MSITSVISFRLCRSAADFSRRRPSSPRPWKLYGLLRGLNAPPRSTFAPARFTAAALDSTCSSLSAEQGPAITITSSPPIRRSSMTMTLFSVLKDRLASLYGSVIRCTSCTPSSTSRSAVSNCRDPPTAPSTVRSAPVDRCTSKPISISLPMTLWTCSSVARSRMTTTMVFSLLMIRFYRFGNPFEMPRLIDDPLEQPLDGRHVERPVVPGLHVLEHFRFAFRLVNRPPHRALDAPDLERAGRPRVEQADQRLVQQIDPLSQVLELRLHACPFSQRT